MTTKVVPDLIDAVIPTVPTLAHGTYTPSTFNGAQVSSSSANPCQYMRIGNTVTVSGSLNVTTTTSGTGYVSISLPVASNFANNYDASGLAQSNVASSTSTPGYCYADTTNDRVVLTANYVSGSTYTLWFQVTYLVI